MYITIGDILQAGVIPDMQTLTAPPHFAALPVEHTSIQGIYELPIRSFIREHELVFSSSVGADNEAPRYIQLIDEVHDGKGSAIILTFQTPDYRPPEEVMNHARKLGIPLFLIPWERRLFETQMDIINLMSNIKMRVINELQNALFNLSFESQGLEAAAKKISQALQLSVCITDLSGSPLAQSSESEDLTTETAAQKAQILLNDRPVGWLLLGRSDHREDPISDPDIISRFVCFPLSLWFYRKNIEDLTIAQLKNDFVWKLANASPSSFEEMAYQGHQLGFDLSVPYTCLLLEIRHQGEASNSLRHINHLASRQSDVQNTLTEIGKQLHLKIMFSSHGTQYIIYLEHRPSAQCSVDSFLDLAEQSLSALVPCSSLYWGVSESPQDFTDFTTLYQHAVLALSYSQHSQNQHYRFTYQDTKQALITVLLSQDPVLKADARDIMERLTAYSDPSGMDLFGTLVTYIRCNYNTSLTARNLYIHRQSLLYRLGKIEELTGMSLKEHKDLFLLEIYSHIYIGY